MFPPRVVKLENTPREDLTAEQNLEFAGRVWRMSSGDRRARARELLEQFGLGDRRGALASGAAG
jgi:ABC-2 type transport system ATP-binding protein